MTIPAGIREPFFAVEFDPTQADQGPGELQYTALIIGQRTAAAAAAPGAPAADTLHRITSESGAIDLGGRGSILHRQAVAWYASNRQTPLYLGVLDDDGGGAAAAGTITVTGPATETGTIALYLGGERRTVGVTVGDTADDIAAAINDEIALALDQPITSTVLAAVVTTTFRHKGEVGNAYDVRHSFNDGEALPAGVGLTIVQTTGGTSNPSLDNLIAGTARCG
jgi:phage tail sheath gpL-like